MTTFTAIARRHPAPVYFLMTFLISWGGTLVAIGSAGGMRGTTPTSDPRFAYALFAMLAGPSVSALLLTALVQGRAGLRDLRSRLIAWRTGAVWYAATLLTAPLLMIATLLALSIASPAFVPGIVTSSDKGTILVAGVAVGIAAGIFEELGWTGFAIPMLKRRYGVLATGLIVGVWWSAWHLLPNVWASRAASAELAMPVFLVVTVFGVFVGYLTAFRVLMVWVYDRTESLLLAMLMHVSLTASLLILNPVALAGAALLTYSVALAAALWIVVAVVGVINGWAIRPALRRRPA